MAVKLTFHGAAGTVTGSRYLLTTDISRVLIDCGLFQGVKELRRRNWQPFPVPAEEIDAVFLTHAHLDHSGYLPALVKQGFTGSIYCSQATFDLCKLLLLDAARLAEEEAAYNNLHHTSKHHPALALFTTDDAEKALDLFVPIERDQVSFKDLQVNFHCNGHILGSCYLDVDAEGRHILFSGDLGRPSDVIMPAPQPPCFADYLVIESTYGDRLHENHNINDSLGDIIGETIRHGGTVLIPAFAVGRSQMILYILHKLRQSGKIPHVPIYLDSPMAISATQLLQKHHKLHRLNSKQVKEMEADVHFCRTVEQSMGLNSMDVPTIIVSASGMATGGRVLHHMKRLIVDERNCIIFAGFQARGTRGHRIVSGEEKIKIFGQYYPVNAQIVNYDYLSAHADRNELLDWVKQMPVAPKQCFVTHGEEESSLAMAQTLRDSLGWKTNTPKLGESVEF